MEVALARIKVLEEELATTREELGRIHVQNINLISWHEENEKYAD
jgi:hypothetical protein